MGSRQEDLNAVYFLLKQVVRLAQLVIQRRQLLFKAADALLCGLDTRGLFVMDSFDRQTIFLQPFLERRPDLREDKRQIGADVRATGVLADHRCLAICIWPPYHHVAANTADEESREGISHLLMRVKPDRRVVCNVLLGRIPCLP